jgi:hypothetical protein
MSRDIALTAQQAWEEFITKIKVWDAADTTWRSSPKERNYYSRRRHYFVAVEKLLGEKPFDRDHAEYEFEILLKLEALRVREGNISKLCLLLKQKLILFEQNNTTMFRDYLFQ